MKLHSIVRSTLALLAMIGIASAQEEKVSEAMKAAQAQNATYVAAFNKGDVKALTALYAQDAEYTTDSGETIAGREAVQQGLSKFFGQNKGAKLEVQIESARFLTPDVLVEKGISTLDGESTRYVCQYVKNGNAWLISDLNETKLPPLDAAEQALGELGWLVGKWKDNSPGLDVTTEVAWTKNEHFLRRSFTITREEGETVEGTEVIGYDPAAGQIRSWIFDSEGGFGEGRWKREGNKWMITASATAPDGSTSTAQHIITVIDDKKFTWESINRQSDGEVLPNLDKVEVVRTGAQ